MPLDMASSMYPGLHPLRPQKLTVDSFCTYDMSKRLLASPSEDINNLGAWKVLLAGGIAGCISWATIFPLDVIKTRIQSQPLLVAKAPSTTSTLSHTPSNSPLLVQI